MVGLYSRGAKARQGAMATRLIALNGIRKRPPDEDAIATDLRNRLPVEKTDAPEESTKYN